MLSPCKLRPVWISRAPSMLNHTATATMIVMRFPTVVQVVDGRDNRIVVAHRAIVLGDETDLIPMVVISAASRVTEGKSVLFIPSRDLLYHLEALMARASLDHFKVLRDRPNPANLISPPLIRPSSSTSTSIILRCPVTRIIH